MYFGLAGLASIFLRTWLMNTRRYSGSSPSRRRLPKKANAAHAKAPALPVARVGASATISCAGDSFRPPNGSAGTPAGTLPLETPVAR